MEQSARKTEPEIFPVGIGGLDQINLVLATIGFDRFFAVDGLRNQIVHLVPDQQLAAISLGEARNMPVAMFADASHEVRRDTG